MPQAGWEPRDQTVYVKQLRGSQAPVGLITPLLALQPLGEPLCPSLKGCWRLLGLPASYVWDTYSPCSNQWISGWQPRLQLTPNLNPFCLILTMMVKSHTPNTVALASLPWVLRDFWKGYERSNHICPVAAL